MDTLEWVLIIGGGVALLIVVFILITHSDDSAELSKTKRQFRKFLQRNGIAHPRSALNNMMSLLKISFKDPEDQDKTMLRVMKCYSASGNYLREVDNGLDIAVAVSKDKDPEDNFTVPTDDFDMFFRSFRFIVEVDPYFGINHMITAYKTCKKKSLLEHLSKKDLFDLLIKKRDLLDHVDKKYLLELIGRDEKREAASRAELIELVKSKNVPELLKENLIYELFTKEDLLKIMNKREELESFARAWIDQKNAGLEIEFDTAMEFISKGRNFSRLVNLDILAKREDIEIDEKNLINAVDDEGLNIIIRSLIRAKYEGVYMSDSESRTIDKANVVEYADSFKVTVDLLKTLYRMKRDVKRFTDVMIRAHNAGINISFSMMDLFSMTDEQFDVLVSNIIKASNKGISIDQNDLIRQNIQGNDITQLVKALIKANEYNLDLTPDELMSYIASTHSDVVKFVKAYNYALVHKLPSEDGTPLSKDHLVEYSRPEADLYDYMKGLKTAIDVKENCKKDFSKNLMAVRAEGKMSDEDINELEPEDFDRGINYENLKKHFIKFGSVMPVIEAMRLGDKDGLNMDFKLGTKICESKDWTLEMALRWAKTPCVTRVEPDVSCVTKDGIMLSAKVNATIRGKLNLLFSGYGEDILFRRINEAVTTEFETAENLDFILKNLPEISHKVLHRVNEERERQEIKTGRVKEMELNNVCRYDLLDINIYDLLVGKNVKAELNMRQAEIDAEIRRMKAEADRARAEADLRRAMVEQYEKGIKPNFNELHKANLLAAKADDITTGYEHPE
ncbi:MAG: flotillin-like FloA family protein [Bacteroidales bacterium]|nr:flotillin-like FloA family protein [Bacteroidales bacterium]